MDQTAQVQRMVAVGGMGPLTGKRIGPVEFIAHMLQCGLVGYALCGNLHLDMLADGQSVEDYMAAAGEPEAEDFGWLCSTFSFVNGVSIMGCVRDTLDEETGEFQKSAEFLLLDTPTMIPGYSGKWRRR